MLTLSNLYKTALKINFDINSHLQFVPHKSFFFGVFVELTFIVGFEPRLVNFILISLLGLFTNTGHICTVILCPFQKMHQNKREKSYKYLQSNTFISHISVIS